MCVSCIDRL